MKDLAIVNRSSEREITGFIDGCKDANALPEISATDLMKAIYHELGKEYNDNSKPRYDKATYTNSLRRTKEYFKI